MKLSKGDFVKVLRVPKEIKGMPKETIEIFKKCKGKIFPIENLDNQQGYLLIELDVSKETTGKFKKLTDTIWIEPEYIKKII